MKKALTEETLLDHLVDFAQNLRYEDLPEDVVREAKRRLIDAVGCALGGLNDPAVRDVTNKTICPVEDRNGFILGRGSLFMPVQAAYANTHMIRVLDWNDTYLSLEPAHPSDNIGALLALVGMKEISGKDFLAAMVLAYDIQCRFCDAASLRDRGWDHTYYVQIASALGAAKLLGLSREKMKTAVSLAMRKVPLRQIRSGTQLSMAKGTAAAEAVREAVWSVLLAQKGMTGPSEMVEGQFGMISQVTGPLRLAAFDNLGNHFKLPETYIKFYPVEYHAQAVVEAALRMRNRISDLAAVERFIIQSYEQARGIIGGPEKRTPETKESADHSLFYILAVTLLDGEMTLRQYDLRRFRDPQIMDLINKMGDIIVVPSYNEAYKRNEFPVSVQAFMGGEELVTAFIYLPKGHPRNPLSNEELEQKFFEKAGDEVPLMYRGKRLDAILSNLRRIEEFNNACDAFEVEEEAEEDDYAEK